jgi:hypothetical protein
MGWLRFGAVLLAGVVARVATGHPVTVQCTWLGKVAPPCFFWPAAARRSHALLRGPMRTPFCAVPCTLPFAGVRVRLLAAVQLPHTA